MTIEQIAEVAYGANKVYCETIGDFSFDRWVEAPDWQKETLVNGVQFHLDHPDAGQEDYHNSWLAEKLKAGWKYGEVKDPEKKEHPCCLPYDNLPDEQKVKDALFTGIVNALKVLLPYSLTS